MEEAIYSLVDPRDNLEFYVGRTQDIYKRFIQHLRCEGKNDAKNARIRELRSLHLVPGMRTLEVVKDDTALAAQREAYWIRHFRYLGIELTNDIVYSGSSDEEEIQEFVLSKQRRIGKLLTVAQAATELNCTERHIRELRRKGRLAKNDKGLITASSLKEYKKNKSRLEA